MAKSPYQKMKILYLMRIMLEDTDADHAITMQDILQKLRNYGIEAERKSVYDDLELLRLYGINIVGEKRNKQYYYRVDSREFELAEIKTLIDIVQSAKSLSERKSRELIEKLENQCSKFDARQLNRDVKLENRVKTTNEHIYSTVDIVNTAMRMNLQVAFRYLYWTPKKTLMRKYDDNHYIISPWALNFNNGKYYIVAYDESMEGTKHFRVDKIYNIEMVPNRRVGREMFKKFDVALHDKKTFSMFYGKEETITMIFANHLAGVIIDRFGLDTPMRPYNADFFMVHLRVAVSIKFYSWVVSFGEDAKVLAPTYIAEELRCIGLRTAKIYDKNTDFFQMRLDSED